MTQSYPTKLETRRLNSIARRFARAACAERRADLDSLLDEGVRFLMACRDAGMPADYIVDSAKGLHDELSKLFAGINRDLDDVGEPPAPPLEMCELNDLILFRGPVMTDREMVAAMIADIERLQSIIDDLVAGCNAMRGLIHLILARDDISPELREVLATSHRFDEAADAIERATATMQRIAR